MGLFNRKGSADALADIGAKPATTREPEHRAAVRAGVPGHCPQCDGFGYIDHIDMTNRLQTQHCRECGHTWKFSFDEEGAVIDLTDGAMRAQRESRSVRS